MQRCSAVRRDRAGWASSAWGERVTGRPDLGWAPASGRPLGLETGLAGGAGSQRCASRGQLPGSTVSCSYRGWLGRGGISVQLPAWPRIAQAGRVAESCTRRGRWAHTPPGEPGTHFITS